MITNIRPILLRHIVTLIIAADKDAVVTMTVLFRPNDDNKSGKSHAVQFTGSHEELDADLPRRIAEAAAKVTESGNTLAELDAKIAEAKKEKEALLKAEKDAAKKKPAAVPAAAPKADDENADDEDEGGDTTVVRKVARPAPKPKLASVAPSTSGLVPAMPPAAPTQPTLADLGL